MSTQLQVTKVTKGGRIYLGAKAAEALGVQDGDTIQIIKDRKVVFIAKVAAPAIANAVECPV